MRRPVLLPTYTRHRSVITSLGASAGLCSTRHRHDGITGLFSTGFHSLSTMSRSTPVGGATCPAARRASPPSGTRRRPRRSPSGAPRPWPRGASRWPSADRSRRSGKRAGRPGRAVLLGYGQESMQAAGAARRAGGTAGRSGRFTRSGASELARKRGQTPRTSAHGRTWPPGHGQAECWRTGARHGLRGRSLPAFRCGPSRMRRARAKNGRSGWRDRGPLPPSAVPRLDQTIREFHNHMSAP